VVEAQEAADVVFGMFQVNTIFVIVLFHSGPSHHFISAAYVEKHILLISLLKCKMIVSSPGGDMPVRQLCSKVNLKIRRVDFVTNLIVLESKGIDVIFEIDWLRKHKVLIDYAKKSVMPTTSNGKELEYIAEPVVTAKGVANRVKLNQLDASQGPNVPGMQLDQDIEFVIELVSGTTPIYKRPYRMAANQLAKLKYQIKELLEKGYMP
jgi:hypothetical protein